MVGDPALGLDPRLPNLRPEVVRGYLDAPPTMVAEVIGGELSLVNRPRPRHALAAGELYGELRGPFHRGRNGPGGWVFLREPELHLGPRPDIVVPDLAGWRRERVTEAILAPDAPAYLEIVPDWVCEVLSPSTRVYDRVEKMPVYRREGVGHVWLADPELRTLEIFRLEGTGKFWVKPYHSNGVNHAYCSGGTERGACHRAIAQSFSTFRQT